ncbi:tetratricopeptide repeat protein [Vibrio nigripulchritudo]|uniref:tetratricopeptide repeat protein n=1 Tax=Vibrio nigripulchritudo TaxID=28173 RepID=UPI00249162B0|nr:tetratricopeptide repeat protein [Vibrio nigripulchritudo]BDU40844.1 hypothetical protein TUMSATVNIG2_53130 [Vibrio nigripulchritudo]BDU46581.1 hypothetical protein TUMSATVNIG3_53790 [Vibrio nigripulchritudo]
MDSEQVVERSEKAVIDRVTTLMEEGLYLDALHMAESQWGNHADWEETQQLELLAKLLRQLGRARAAEYLTLKIWRRNKSDSNAAFRAFFYFFYQKGAVHCHDILAKWRELASKPSEVSDWIAAEAIFYSRLRDFATTHRLLDEASEHSDSQDWLTRIRVRVLEEEGKREEAYQLALTSYEDKKTPAALESLASLTKLYKGKQAAMALMEPLITEFQSVPLWLDYAILCFDNLEMEKCEQALEKVAKYSVHGTKRSDDYLQYLKAEIALHNQDLARAVEHLQSARTPFNKILKENLERSSDFKPVLKVAVPDIAQKHMTCAPSSLAAIAQFWGKEVNEDEIASLICYGGTPEESQREWLSDNGFAYLEFDLEEQAVMDVLGAGIPLTLVTTQGLSSHLQVVRGYDPNSGLLMLMDPSNTGNRKALLKETIECDAVNGPKCVAIVPEEQESKLALLSLPAANLYPTWRKLEAAYAKEDVAALNRHLRAMASIDDQHRLILLGQRLAAILTRDNQTIYDLNKELLQRFPDVVYLIRSQYQCIYALEGEKPAIDWLAEQYKAYGHGDIFNNLLAATDSKPEYQELRNSLIQQGKASIWGSAEFFWNLGHASWEQLDKEQACQYYFWAVCLDHINSSYIRSYYLAYRQLGRSEEVLEALKADFERSITASVSPAYSLFYAYEMEDRMEQAFDTLKVAAEKHPDDPSLHHMYLEKLLSYGVWDTFNPLFELKSHVLDEIDRQRLLAAKESRLGNNLKAIKLYAKVSENPVSSVEDLENYLNILKRTGMVQEADQVLGRRLKESPDSAALLWSYSHLHSLEEKRIDALKQLLEKFPNDYDAMCKLAEHYLDQEDYSNAKPLLDKLEEAQPNSANVWVQIARYHSIHSEWAEAQRAACNAYQLNPNHDLVTTSMVRSHIGPKDRLRAFAFMIDVLKKSGDISDAIWNFWSYADGWLPLDQMRSFCEEMLELHSDTWSVWVLRVLQHKSENELDEALALAQQCCDKFSLIPRVFYEKAELHLLKQDKAAAAEAFETALTLAPGWSTVAKAYYDLLEEQGEAKRGLAILEKCKSHNPNDESLYGYIGYCYKEFGRDERAIELIEQALHIDVDYLWAWRALRNWTQNGERFHNLLNAKKVEMSDRPEIFLVESQLVDSYEEKKACLEKALALSPTYIHCHIHYIDLLIEHREDSLALEQIDAPIWQGTPPITIAIKRAEIFARWGDMGQAMKSLSDLLSDNPRFVEAWKLKLDWAKALNSRSEMLESVEALVKLCPHDPEILIQCARGYEELDSGKYEGDILQLFENAYSIAPSNADAAFSLLDFYLQLSWLEKAQHQLTEMERFHESPWLDVRRIEIDLRYDLHESVLARYERLLMCGEDTEWLYAYSLHIAEQKDNHLYRKLMIMTKVNLGDDRLDPAAASSWAEKEVQEKFGFDTVKEVLRESEVSDAVWKAISREYLSGVTKRNQYPDDAFWQKYDQLTEQFPDMVDARCLALFLLERRYELVTYMSKADKFDNPNVSAASYYYLATTSAEIKNYDVAKRAVETGLQRSPDNSFDRLCLWRLNFAMRDHQPVYLADLERVNPDRLSEEEKTILRLLKIAAHCYEKTEQGQPLSGSDTKHANYLNIQTGSEQDAKKALIKYVIQLKQLTGIAALYEKFKLGLKIK